MAGGLTRMLAFPTYHLLAVLWSHVWNSYTQLVTFGMVLGILQVLLKNQESRRKPLGQALVDFSYVGLNTVLVSVFLAWTTPDLAFYKLRQYVLSFGPFANGYLELFMAVVLCDFVAYWRHRLTHIGVLWKVHAIHHSSTVLNWLSAYRLHPLNAMINAFMEFTALYLAGFSGQAIVAATTFHVVYVLFVHSNIEVNFGVFGYIFVSPNHHRIHHSADAKESQTNFAFCFSAFDLIFGTYSGRRTVKETGCGPAFPQKGLMAQLMYPIALDEKLLASTAPSSRTDETGEAAVR